MGIDDEVIVFGLVSRIVWEKGFRELIQVLNILKEASDVPFKFVHAGIGPEDENVKRLIRQNGLDDHVIFLGYRTDVHQLMLAFDIVIFPSHREGFGTNVLEAMAMELPVVAFNIRGCREGIDDDKTGFLVPFGDTKEMATRAKELMANSHLRHKMGQAGRKRVSSFFTKQRHVDLQLEVYHKVWSLTTSS